MSAPKYLWESFNSLKDAIENKQSPNEIKTAFNYFHTNFLIFRTECLKAQNPFEAWSQGIYTGRAKWFSKKTDPSLADQIEDFYKHIFLTGSDEQLYTVLGIIKLLRKCTLSPYPVLANAIMPLTIETKQLEEQQQRERIYHLAKYNFQQSGVIESSILYLYKNFDDGTPEEANGVLGNEIYHQFFMRLKEDNPGGFEFVRRGWKEIISGRVALDEQRAHARARATQKAKALAEAKAREAKISDELEALPLPPVATASGCAAEVVSDKLPTVPSSKPVAVLA